MSATHSKFSPGGEGRLESATQEANSYPGNFSQLQQLFHQVDLRNKDLCFVLDFQENLTLSKFLPTTGTLDFAFLRFEGSFEQCEFFLNQFGNCCQSSPELHPFCWTPGVNGSSFEQDWSSVGSFGHLSPKVGTCQCLPGKVGMSWCLWGHLRFCGKLFRVLCFNDLIIEVTFFEISSLLSSRPQCVPIAYSDLRWPWHYLSPHFLVAPH